MNSKQCKALTNIVKYNFIPTLHLITSEYVFLSIGGIQDESRIESYIDFLIKCCLPCKSSFTYDGVKLSGYLYK